MAIVQDLKRPPMILLLLLTLPFRSELAPVPSPQSPPDWPSCDTDWLHCPNRNSNVACLAPSDQSIVMYNNPPSAVVNLAAPLTIPPSPPRPLPPPVVDRSPIITPSQASSGRLGRWSWGGNTVSLVTAGVWSSPSLLLPTFSAGVAAAFISLPTDTPSPSRTPVPPHAPASSAPSLSPTAPSSIPATHTRAASSVDPDSWEWLFIANSNCPLPSQSGPGAFLLCPLPVLPANVTDPPPGMHVRLFAAALVECKKPICRFELFNASICAVNGSAPAPPPPVPSPVEPAPEPQTAPLPDRPGQVAPWVIAIAVLAVVIVVFAGIAVVVVVYQYRQRLAQAMQDRRRVLPADTTPLAWAGEIQDTDASHYAAASEPTF
eukprot:TRINITY_DN60538_c0_g1_i1.p1 TRINITY_DN60538_c0_g1~~TRINITY_DN60538_c0_g1_i1.p1  ORF type:complete len:376 (+),score=31.88 TRINITY_DN60538_c0_g1_i1:130-1257(+)